MSRLEITVLRKQQEGWPVQLKRRGRDGLPREVNDWLRFPNEMDPRPTLLALEFNPKEYGACLGRALFSEKVLPFWRLALNDLSSEDDPGLNVALTVEDESLAGLFWSWLQAPLFQDMDFLSQNNRIHFTRHLHADPDHEFHTLTEKDVSALLLVASPSESSFGLEPFDGSTIIEEFHEALADFPHDVLAPSATDANCQGAASLESLSRQLVTKSYSILHLVAHGRIISGKNALFLLNETGGEDPIDADWLQTQLGRSGALPHLVFLMACHGGSPLADMGEGRGGIAQRLVRELGIPAVVAMTGSISTDTAKDLIRPFYRSLFRHGNVARALSEASSGLCRRSDINVPVIYSRLGDRPLYQATRPRILSPKRVTQGLEILEGAITHYGPSLQHALQEKVQVIRDFLDRDELAPKNEENADWSHALSLLDELCNDTFEMGFDAIAAGKKLPGFSEKCPFPGARPFQADEAGLFFGRESLIEQICDHLQGQTLLVLHGEKESGKTSLARAGLMPKLGKAGHQVHYQSLESNKEQPPDFISWPKPSEFLILDHFEVVANSLAGKKLFRDLLHHAAKKSTEVGGVILIASDGGSWATREVPCVTIPPLEPLQLRFVLSKMADIAGLSLENEVTQALHLDFMDQPRAMSYLQRLMEELWRRRHGRWLRQTEYHQLIRERQEKKRQRSALIAAVAMSLSILIFVALFFVYGWYQDAIADHVRDLVDLARTANDQGHHEKALGYGHEALTSPVSVQTNYASQAEAQSYRALSQLRENHLLAVSERQVDQVFYTPDGSQLVTISADAVRFWDTASGVLSRTLPARKVFWAAFNSDGSRFATASRSGPVHLWDPTVEQPLSWLEKTGFLLADAAFLDDGQTLALASNDGRIFHWNEGLPRKINEGRPAARNLGLARGADNALFSLTLDRQNAAFLLDLSGSDPDRSLGACAKAWVFFSSDRRHLALICLRKLIRVWPQGRADALYLDSPDPLLALAFSPDGRYLATAGETGRLGLWNLDSRQLVFTSPRYGRALTSLAFGPKGQHLAAGADDGALFLYHVPSGRRLAQLDGHRRSLSSLAFSPDGAQLASASAGGNARLWDLTLESRLSFFKNSDEDLTALALDPSAGTMFLAGRKQVTLWDREKGGPRGSTDVHSSRVTLAVFSPDGKWGFTACGGAKNLIWRVATGQVIAEPEAQLTKQFAQGFEADPRGKSRLDPGLSHAAFSHNGDLLATSGQDGDVHIYTVPQGIWLKRFVCAQPASWVDIHPGGKLLLVGYTDGKARLWHLETGRSQELPGHGGDVIRTAFSPEGTRLATASAKGMVRLWNAQGQFVANLDHVGLSLLAFSPAGGLLVTAGEAGIVRWWSAEDGRLLTSQSTHGAGVGHVRFNRDGSRLLSTSLDGGAAVWDGRHHAVVALLQGHAQAIRLAGFSEDGQLAVTCSEDGSLRVWPVYETAQLIETSKRVLAVQTDFSRIDKETP